MRSNSCRVGVIGTLILMGLLTVTEVSAQEPDGIPDSDDGQSFTREMRLRIWYSDNLEDFEQVFDLSDIFSTPWSDFAYDNHRRMSSSGIYRYEYLYLLPGGKVRILTGSTGVSGNYKMGLSSEYKGTYRFDPETGLITFTGSGGLKGKNDESIPLLLVWGKPIQLRYYLPKPGTDAKQKAILEFYDSETDELLQRFLHGIPEGAPK
ncbi:MAG: hypothetical protein LUF87_05700 [Alistipes sp.]|nr:hypothetical protein [Alistipes sp.]